MIPIHAIAGGFKFQLIEWRRYAFNSVSYLITIYLVFLLLFFGAQFVAGPAGVSGERLEDLLTGYLVWMFAMMAYTELAYSISNESQVGTLEQLFLSPSGFLWITAGRMLGNFIVNLVLNSTALAAIMFTTGQTLNLQLGSTVPLLLAVVFQSYGLGLALGGLALMFKRIQSSFQILQFLMVGLVAVPVGVPGSEFLPLTHTSRLINRVMVDGETLFGMGWTDLALAAAVTALWLAVGVVVFNLCDRRARERGLLGRY